MIVPVVAFGVTVDNIVAIFIKLACSMPREPTGSYPSGAASQLLQLLLNHLKDLLTMWHLS